MPSLILELDNVTNLPDGGPTNFTVLGSRSVDIGRDTYLDWTLPDPNRIVSGRHCEIRYRDGGYVLTDRSTNGTYLNGSDKRLTEPTRLKTGDTIDVGPYIIKVTVHEDEGAAPPAPLDDGSAFTGSAQANMWDEPEAAPPAPVTEPKRRGGAPVLGDALDWRVDLPQVDDRAPPPTPSTPLAPPAMPPSAPPPGAWDAAPPQAHQSQPPEPSAWDAPAAPQEPAPPSPAPGAWDEAPAPPPPADAWGDPTPPAPPAGAWDAPQSPEPAGTPAPSAADWGAPTPEPLNFDKPVSSVRPRDAGETRAPTATSPPTPTPTSPPPEDVAADAPPAPSWDEIQPAPAPDPEPAHTPAAAPTPAAETREPQSQPTPAPTAERPQAAVEEPALDVSAEPQPTEPPAPPKPVAPPPQAAPVPPSAPDVPHAAPPGSPPPASPPAASAMPSDMPREPGSAQPFAVAPDPQQPSASPYAPPPPRHEGVPAHPVQSAGSDDYEAFLARLSQTTGVPVDVLRAEGPDAMADRLGRFMVHSVGGLHALLKARARARGFLRSDRGTTVEAVGNNPMKFLPTPEDVLRVLMGPPTRTYLSMDEALSESYQDVSTHQVATYTAMQDAVKRLTDDLGPDAVEEAAGDDGSSGGGGSLGRMMGGGSNRKAKLWDTFKERWTARSAPYDNGMVDVFMMHFSEAYGRAMRKKP